MRNSGTTSARSQLFIAEPDECRMEEWRRLYPGDVDYERAFDAQKRRKKAFIEAELNGLSTILDDDDWWDDLWLTTKEDTASSSVVLVCKAM
jgi:hypothetical protein